VSVSEQRPAEGDTAGYKRHMLTELQFSVRRELAETGELTGEAKLTPFMHVPGTTALRTSILLMWADMLGGLLSLVALRPGVPVTLELDVHLYRPAPGSGILTAVGRTVKAGRSVHVVESQFADSTGAVFAFSTGSFMASPDTSLTVEALPPLPSLEALMRVVSEAPTLAVPLGERARVARVAPGVAELPMSDEGLNSSNTMHGGLIAMVAEEAALSLAPAGSTLSSLGVRYLSPVRTGPAVASAAGHHGLYRAEIRDDGTAGRLAALATARMF
jgi:acyl-coenzyme A thioesterase PaaI-like protein